MASSQLPPLLLQAFQTQKVWDDRGNLIPLDSNVSIEEAMLLNATVLELRPTCSVEVGLAKGVSTLAVLGALAQNGAGNHIVIDPFQAEYGNAGVEMVSRAGLDPWWEFHRKFAEEVIPSIGPIQFAFIDASHLFDLTLMEFILVDKKLDVGGVIGFHDLWMPSLQSLFRYIVRNRAYEVWMPSGFEFQKDSKQNSWKSALRRLLRSLPASDRMFTPEFLRPWSEEGLGNLVLIRKRSNDSRDWRFHERF
jgi:hypothetical protein